MTETGTVATLAEVGESAPTGYDLIRAQARASAGSPAVLVAGAPGPPVSYAGLVDRVDALAGRLRAAGVGPEQPVAVLLDRSTDAVVAMLGVLAAGGAYCPLDPTAPDARLALIVRALGARVAIAGPAEAVRLPGGIAIL